jgi:hypothetical protein
MHQKFAILDAVHTFQSHNRTSSSLRRMNWYGFGLEVQQGSRILRFSVVSEYSAHQAHTSLMVDARPLEAVVFNNGGWLRSADIAQDGCSESSFQLKKLLTNTCPHESQ